MTKLKKRIKVLDLRIIVNAGKKDYELVEQIAKALNIQIGEDGVSESVESKSGFTGDVEYVRRGLV